MRSKLVPFAVGAALMLAVELGAHVAVDTMAVDPGPIPTCFKEQATHVLVEWKGNAADSLAPYQAWIAAGVSVQANDDELLLGTEGHDVLVALVETHSGGFVSNPAPASSQNPPAAGDFACSFLVDADDIYYMNKGRGDKVFDASGSDDYYLGGCELDGKGSPGDRRCDLMIDKGEGGVYTGDFRGHSDAVWTHFVPAGRTTVLREGPAQTHNYAGRGPGKVIIYGGDCFVHVDHVRVPCEGNVKADGDHVHPCPVTDDILTSLPSKDNIIRTNLGIRTIGVEYIGPEAPLTDDVKDPCHYQSSDL